MSTTPLFHSYSVVADVYGNGAYGSQVYSSTGAATTGTGSHTASGTSYLADTGTFAVIFITLACIIVVIALTVRIWRRPAKKKALDSPPE